jgi:hypothetical protein
MKAIYLNDLDGKSYVVQSKQGQSTLDFLQGLVEGLIECVSLDRNTDLWVNEEGLFREDFSLNLRASKLAGDGYALVGPAVIAGIDYDKGETIEVGSEFLRVTLAGNPNIYSVEEIVALRASQLEVV